MTAGGTIVFGGHSTVLIDLDGTRLVTDPLLRGRLFGLMRRHHGFDAEDLGDVDGVLISHLHHDHLDFPSLRRLGAVRVLAPPGGGEFIRRRGFADVTELAPGQTAPLGGVTIRGVEALHEGGRLSGRGPGETVGYVVEGSRRIYFAGDTDLFEDMAQLGPGIDVALLPIWGWGPKLGEGHLGPESAAQAAAMIRPRIVVPIHWGSLAPAGGIKLWPWLFERPVREFREAMAATAPGVELRVVAPGDALALT
jgi:L-ascorbate metabolism protein UlaG (beta-lactamase superfamily)